MVKTRNRYELDLMRKSGEISGKALKKVLVNAKAGATGLELDKIAEKVIKGSGGGLSFKTVKGYKWTSCVTLNEQIVHGIPNEKEFKEGDIVSIDLGTLYKGWHTDCAWSVLVPTRHPEFISGSSVKEIPKQVRNDREKFLNVGEEALWLGIKQAVHGNHVGDISDAIQKKVEGGGYSVVRTLVGHGIGRLLHEDPEVPGYGEAGKGILLKDGMTLAIEVIYTAGAPDVILEEDGWTVSSKDGSMAGLFEMSVIVGRKKAEVLTDWKK